MKLADFIREATGRLEGLYPGREARSIVMILCETLLGTKSYTHIVEPGYMVPAEMEQTLEAAMQRLCGGEPLQYVTGQADFFGRTFKVGPSVLIPRPETELLCREAIDCARRMMSMRPACGKPSLRVLDLCTGSGCIAWTMALELPGIEVVGVDISRDALQTASSQDFPEIRENGSRISFVEADVLETGSFPDLGRFDIILSNPPYIKECEKAQMRRNVLEHEPSLALFVPDEDPQIFYRAVASLAKRLLESGGFGMVEINEEECLGTQEVMRDAGFSGNLLMRDLNDRGRFVIFS